MSSNLRILAYVCENHALSAVESIPGSNLSIPESIDIIKVPCAGRVETVHMLNALRSGADGVVMIGCLEENCYHNIGSRLARGRLARCREILEDISIEPERVEMINTASLSRSILTSKLEQFEKRLADLPKSPFKGAII